MWEFFSLVSSNLLKHSPVEGGLTHLSSVTGVEMLLKPSQNSQVSQKSQLEDKIASLLITS